ncbi:4975_t:CDS:2, partial [Racocetra persica]
QENTGGDTVAPASTAVYIKKISRVENEATGINYLEQAIKALPSNALKKSSTTIDIPMGSYTQQIIGFNSSGSLDTGQKGDKLTIKLNGTNLSVRVHGKSIKREFIETKVKGREIGPAELETREEETEEPMEEEIDIDNLEMEEPEGEIGDLTGELEEESETE